MNYPKEVVNMIKQYNNIKLFDDSWGMNNFILLNKIKSYFWDYRFSTKTYELYYD